jgi:anti-sigma factor RsiW
MNGDKTMQCAITKRMLSVYLDGELPEGENKRVEGHLTGCLSCRESLERMRAVWALVGVPVPEAHPYLATRVIARLNDRPRLSPAVWIGRLWVPAATLAVMILGFFFGSMFGAAAGSRAAVNPEETAASLYEKQFADFPEASLGQLCSELVSKE